MNPPPLLPVHCNLLLFIPHPRGRRHPFQSTTLHTLRPDIFRNVLQRQKKLKMILSNKEKSVCDVLFGTKLLIYQLLPLLKTSTSSEVHSVLHREVGRAAYCADIYFHISISIPAPPYAIFHWPEATGFLALSCRFPLKAASFINRK